ncbi:FAD binding domain-containing protein [Bipolaris maydis]|nr:FAD binding domain-containing protein [Bipolaris maydis]
MWGATWIHRSALLVYRNFLPGQYVYLTTLRPGFFSIFQRHPFMVIRSESENYNFQLYIQPQMGFTNRLLTHTLGGTTELSALVEGPYGNGFDLRDFGTVVLFASGIGIAGHLAYVQSLIYDYRKFKTKTRDLLLVWQVDNKYQLDLVWGVMNNILRRDDLPTAANLHGMRNQWESGKRGRGLGSNVTNESPGIIDVYIYRNYKILDKAGHAVPCKRAGSRIAEIEGQPDVQQIISDVLRTRVGRLAIYSKLYG